MTRRFFANAAPQATLQSGINSSATTLTINGSFSGWPTSFPFYATLDLGASAEEIVLVTAIAGTMATITRGQDGSSAVSHAAGATFDFTVVRADFDEANAHVNATTAIHGLASAPVGVSDTQTLTNKTLTNPTINGGSVTGASSITTTALTTTNSTVSGTATVGTVNATTLNASGATTLSGAGTGLAVTNNATVGGTLGVTGNTTVGGTVGVTGTSTLAAVNASGAVALGSTLSVAGASTLAAATVTSLSIGGNPVQAGAWTSFVPTWAGASGSPSVNNGTLTGRYCQIGKLIVAEWFLSIGSTTNCGAGALSFTLPVSTSASQAGFAVGRVFATNSGVYFTAGALLMGANAAKVDVYLPASTSASNVVPMAFGAPWNFKSGDSFNFSIQYEAA